LDGQLDGALARQDDDFAFGVSIPKFFQQFDAGQTGHFEVQDGDIEHPPQSRSQGGFAVRRLMHLKPSTREHSSQGAAKDLVVVNYKQGNIVTIVHGRLVYPVSVFRPSSRSATEKQFPTFELPPFEQPAIFP